MRTYVNCLFLIVSFVLMSILVSCSGSTDNTTPPDLDTSQNNSAAFQQERDAMFPKHLSVADAQVVGKNQSMEGSTYSQFTPEQSINCMNNKGQITLKFKTPEFAKGVTAVYVYMDSDNILKVPPSASSFIIEGDTIRVNYSFDMSNDAIVDYFLLSDYKVNELADNEYALGQQGDALARSFYDRLVKLSTIYQSMVNNTAKTQEVFLSTYEALKKDYLNNITHFNQVAKETSFAPIFWVENENNKWNSGIKLSVDGSETCLFQLK